MKFWSNKGFTLLELLVVISIIGILLAVGSVAFSNAQKKSRDSRRKSDVKALQNAFEQYYAANETYSTCEEMAATTISGGFGAVSDPQPSKSYACSVDSTNTAYCVCAELETGGGNAQGLPANGVCDWNDPNDTNLNDGSYFCARNLQ